MIVFTITNNKELNYCDMCGKKLPLVKLIWVETDEHGPVYFCIPCFDENRTNSTISIKEI